MAVVIALNSELPAYRETVEVDGVVYKLRVYWNTREAAWYVDLNDATDQAILTGRKLTSNWGPFRRFVDSRLPDGFLALFDSTTGNQKPGRGELGSSALLVFLTSDELAA